MTEARMFERRSGDALVQVIANKLENLHSDVGDMKSVLRDLTTAVTKLAVVEERQGQTSLALERAFKVIEKLEVRMDAVEREMPSLIEKKGWIVLAMLGVAGAVGTAMLKGVIQ